MGPYCKSCFCTTIEKRVRKDLRIKFHLKAHEKLVVLNDQSKEEMVSEYIVKSIAKSIPLNITVQEQSNIPEDTRIIIPTSATKVAANFLKHMMLKNNLDKPGKNQIPLLESLNEDEIHTFAQFKNLPFKVIKSNDKFEELVKSIEEQYHSSTFGIVKSKKTLEP